MKRIDKTRSIGGEKRRKILKVFRKFNIFSKRT
jgi:hypothetical protein